MKLKPLPATTLPCNHGVIGDPLSTRHLDARVVNITPTIAQQWLEQSVGNRALSRGTIQRYARDLQSGAWMLDGQAIAISKDGVLVNGHHRLHACIESGVAFCSVVIWGIHRDTFKTWDGGLKRTPAQIFQLAGRQNAGELSAVCRLLYNEEHGGSLHRSGKQQPSTAEMEDVYDRHPDIALSLPWRNGAMNVGLTRSEAIYLHYLLARIDRNVADRFFGALYSGEGLLRGSPILTVRNELLKPARHPGLPAKRAYVVLAWNAWRDGRTLNRIRWTGDQPTPK